MSIRYNTTGFNSDRRNGRKGKLPGYSRQPSNVKRIDSVETVVPVDDSVELPPLGLGSGLVIKL